MTTAAEPMTINPDLKPCVLTDKEKTKTLPCRKCQRACIVTVFATPEKVECSECRGTTKGERREQSLQRAAHTVNPATLEHLRDALINRAFKGAPLCPLDNEHGETELKSIAHSPNYGPRHLVGYEKGIPRYEQVTGETATYQCNHCGCVVSYSTQHPQIMQAQNEAVANPNRTSSALELLQGVR